MNDKSIGKLDSTDKENTVTMIENNNNGADLSQESIKLVEAGKVAHQAVLELAEARRIKIEGMETELKLTSLELDRVRLDVHDIKERLSAVILENQKAEAARVAYETFVILLARQITEFVPPVPPAYVHRQTPKEPTPEAK